MAIAVMIFLLLIFNVLLVKQARILYICIYYTHDVDRYTQ